MQQLPVKQVQLKCDLEKLNTYFSHNRYLIYYVTAQ